MNTYVGAHDVVAPKRKSRSSRAGDVAGQNDLHALREFAENFPRNASLSSLENLDREEPALLRGLSAVEYKDKDRKVS